MRLLTALVALSLLLVPLSGGTGENKGALFNEAKEQRDARRADEQERQEREERLQELQEEHEIEHPAIINDEPKDELED